MSQVFFFDGKTARMIETTGRQYVDCRAQIILTPPPLTTCAGCHNEVDDEICWCGDYIKNHGGEHSPVPMGCECYYDKSLDKDLSLGQHISMCSTNKSVRFVTAVLLAVGELRSSPFSAYSITRKLRDDVNSLALSFLDKSPETVDGIGTFRVVHEEVKDVFRELLSQSIITGLDVQNRGGYLEYSNSTNTQSVAVPIAQLTKPSVAPLTQVSNVNVNTDLQQKLMAYLSNRKGQAITMKEIQSRFKGTYLTCNDYAKTLISRGLKVHNQGPPSRWTVVV